MNTTTEKDIVNILWKALKHVAIENDDSIDNQITVNIKKMVDYRMKLAT